VSPLWEGPSKHFIQEPGAFALLLMHEVLVKRADQILGKSDSRMCRKLLTHVKVAYDRLCLENFVWVSADAMNRWSLGAWRRESQLLGGLNQWPFSAGS
jgi:hypothetical protein